MRRTYRTLYRLGVLPWDQADIPAPVRALVEGPRPLPAGRAVDLGCGTGRQARYLAEHGWSVTGVDYTPEAITAARRSDPARRVHWRVADVTQPHQVDPDGTLTATTTLLLDNGCLHGIPTSRRAGWAATVNTLAAPGAVLLVRAAPRQRRGIRPRGIGPHGIDSHELTALLAGPWQPIPSSEPTWQSYALASTQVA